MTVENEPKEQKPKEEKQIHHTHFPVVKIPLHDTNYNSGYEWVKTAEGRWKRVLKKPDAEEESSAESVSRTHI